MNDLPAKMSFLLLLLLLLLSREAAGSQPSCDRLAEASQDLPDVVPGNYN